MKGSFTDKVNLILKVWNQSKHIDTSLNELYPITIAHEDQFEVYDYNIKIGKYIFIKTVKSQMTLPTEGLRAAMPLDFYYGKCSAVVNIDCFNNLEEMILLLHEFVHCYQYSTVESKLKESLRLSRISQEKGDIMWEIDYEFPYKDEKVRQLLQSFFENSTNDLLTLHHEMRKIISDLDYEYMVWQEWKEGYARYVENKLQEFFDLKKNILKKCTDFNRTVFYELGNRWFLTHSEDLLKEFKKLISI